MKNRYVYEHWRLDRDECFYVGKGRGNRAYSSYNRNAHHRAITEKLRREGSAFEVRIVAHGLTDDEAFQLEIDRIAFWRSVGIDLANILPGGQNGGGGMTGRKHSDETREKMARAQKGRVISEQARQKLREANLGKRASDEARRKMAASRKGRKMPDHVKEILRAARTGYISSEETRQKLSLARKGKHIHSEEEKKRIGDRARARKQTDEERTKRSMALKGRVFSEEHRNKLSEANKNRYANGKSGIYAMAALGRTQLDEEKAKRSAIMKEVWRRRKESAS